MKHSPFQKAESIFFSSARRTFAMLNYILEQVYINLMELKPHKVLFVTKYEFK